MKLIMENWRDYLTEEPKSQKAKTTPSPNEPADNTYAGQSLGSSTRSLYGGKEKRSSGRPVGGWKSDPDRDLGGELKTRGKAGKDKPKSAGEHVAAGAFRKKEPESSVRPYTPTAAEKTAALGKTASAATEKADTAVTAYSKGDPNIKSLKDRRTQAALDTAGVSKEDYEKLGSVAKSAVQKHLSGKEISQVRAGKGRPWDTPKQAQTVSDTIGAAAAATTAHEKSKVTPQAQYAMRAKAQQRSANVGREVAAQKTMKDTAKRRADFKKNVAPGIKARGAEKKAATLKHIGGEKNIPKWPGAMPERSSFHTGPKGDAEFKKAQLKNVTDRQIRKNVGLPDRAPTEHEIKKAEWAKRTKGMRARKAAKARTAASPPPGRSGIRRPIRISPQTLQEIVEKAINKVLQSNQ